MPKQKAQPANPTDADLPQNPEFQAFADFTRRLMNVPKSEIGPQAPKKRDAAPEPPEDDE